MLWSDGRIRFAVRIYLRGCCETVGSGIRLESRGHLAGLRARRGHFGCGIAAARAVDRPLWSAADHSAVHDCVLLRDLVAGATALAIVAVLCNLHHAGSSWERCGPLGVFAVDFDVVPE